MKCPKNTGSYYFNYKGTFSIVLLGLVDADYKFIYIDVGCNGRISDGGVFRNASLSKALEENSVNVPPPRNLPRGHDPLPFVVVADDAFPLKSYLVKPYPHRNLTNEQQKFNYQLSRARRVVENAFGVLACRFRLFLTTINLSPDNAEKAVLASCTLHNYLRTKARDRYTPPSSVDTITTEGEIIDGDWRKEITLTSIQHQGTNYYSKDAKRIREQYCAHFNSF